MVRNFIWLGFSFFLAGFLSAGTSPVNAGANKNTANVATRAIQISQMAHLEEVEVVSLVQDLEKMIEKKEAKVCCGPFC
ncbi:MAG: hypothetical protein K2P90_00080 [Holosporales bacterium]|nr:hypothetical protein [Holosporales bacterium]